MPIYKTYTPNSTTIVKFWKISESFEDLLSSIYLNENSLDKLKKIKYESKKSQLLSIRHLLESVGYNDDDLFYNKQGKPLLKDKKNISISHSHAFSSIIISDKMVSVDIEPMSNKILNIVEKFVDFELSYLNDLNHEISRLTYIWNVKECIYKVIDGLPYMFKDKCIVIPFSKHDTNTKTWVRFNNKLFCFKSYLFSFENHNFAYIIEEEK